MADGWRCPECHLILAPDVREHRCDPPESGGVPARPVPAPYTPPSSSGTYAWPTGATVTVTNACNVYGDCGHASCAVAVRTPFRLVTGNAA